MPTKKSTPVSVRVARWAAAGAAITAFASIFNTMWSERPWWAETSPKASISSIEVENLSVEQMVQATSPGSPNDTVEWSKWFLAGSVIILVGSGVYEVIHRKRQK